MVLTAPCLAQTAPIDQIERLLQLQQAIQQQHAQQLSTLHLQLQGQERASAAQDWLWVMVCTLGLMGLAIALWLAKLWQMRRVGQASQESPAQAPLPGSLFAPPGIDTAESAFGSLKRKAEVAQEDDWDSQMLADDALREFELRRTVGLIPDASAEPPTAQPAPDAHIEQAWADMEEMVLELDADTAAVDLSLEVQKVRKHLQLRRLERSQGTAQLASTASAAAQSVANDESQAPRAELLPEEDDLIIVAREPECAPDPKPEHPIAPLPAPTSPVLTFTQPNTSSAELIFPASQRGMSEMEVRLALAQEFRRLGQMEEAEQLCHEALHEGTAAEKHSARQLLESLPGR
jgi:hypothetical protein